MTDKSARILVALVGVFCATTLAACSSSDGTAPITPGATPSTATASPSSDATASIGVTPSATKTSRWEEVSEPFTVTETAVSGKPVYVTAKVGEPILFSVKLDGDLSGGVGFRQSPDPDLLAPVIPTGAAVQQQKENPTALPMIAQKVGKTALIIYTLKAGEPDRSTAVGFEVTVTK